LIVVLKSLGQLIVGGRVYDVNVRCAESENRSYTPAYAHGITCVLNHYAIAELETASNGANSRSQKRIQDLRPPICTLLGSQSSQLILEKSVVQLKQH
jgi:hypothetical protein